MSELAFFVLWLPVILALILNTLFVIGSIISDRRRRKKDGDKYLPNYSWNDVIISYFFSAVPILAIIAIISMALHLYKTLDLSNRPVVKKK